MPDILITATSLRLVSGPAYQSSAGDALIAGQIVGEHDGKAIPVGAGESGIVLVGMVLGSAEQDQSVVLAENGAVVDLGAAVLTPGAHYVLSEAPGRIRLQSDGGDSPHVGVAHTQSYLKLDFADPDSD